MKRKNIGLLASPTLIIWDRKEHSSGFLFHTNHEILLITSKYSVIDESHDLKFKKAIVYCKTMNDKLMSYVLNINILDKSELFIWHNDFNLVAIRLGTITFDDKGEKFSVNTSNGVKLVDSSDGNTVSWGHESVLHINELSKGDEVFTFNHSCSLNSNINPELKYVQNRIYIRKGIVSDVDYLEKKFVIDCTTFKGDSGSPVFIKAKNNFYLIGMVTENITYREDDALLESKIINAGFTEVIATDLLLGLF